MTRRGRAPGPGSGDGTSAPREPEEGTERPAPPPAPEHDTSGLELARSIARSLARRPRQGGAGGSRSARRRTVEPRSSGAHPDDRDPQTLDTTIGRLVAEQGWGSDVRVHGVFSRWDVIVGRDVAAHVSPVSFERLEDGGTLVVQTDSTAWATQMRLLAPTVVRRLNEELGDRTVTLIEVRGPAAPRWTKGRRSVRDGRGPRDTYG